MPWITIPIMVLAAAFAAGFLVHHSIREHRRVEAEAMIAGKASAPDDGSVRIVAHVERQAVHRTHELNRELGDPSEPDVWIGVETEHTPEGGQILVTVPKDVLDRRPDAPARVSERLENEESIGQVEELRGQRPGRGGRDRRQASA